MSEAEKKGHIVCEPERWESPQSLLAHPLSFQPHTIHKAFGVIRCECPLRFPFPSVYYHIPFFCVLGYRATLIIILPRLDRLMTLLFFFLL